MGRPDVQTIYGLTPQQMGILFETQAADPGLYVEQTTTSIPGPLDTAAFTEAWRRIVQRHDVLRTAFVWKDQPEPVQVVLRHVELPISIHDLRFQPGEAQEQELRSLMERERRQPFDLTKPPLMRITLARTGESSHQLIWTQHHILMDGWCVPILFEELLDIYASSCAGVAPALPAAPQYRDYVGWLKGQDRAAARAFWETSLSAFRRATPLGVEDPSYRPAPEPERYGAAQASLGRDVTALLTAFCRQNRVTLTTALQAAWALTLSAFSNHDTVMFGMTVAGRPSDLPGANRIVGMLMNTTPCVVRVEAEASLAGWLSELQARQAEARRFEHCSTGQIHEWTQVPRSERLYESILVVENYPARHGDGASSGSFVGARTVYTLTLVAEPGDDLALTCVYDSQRLERAGAADILRRLLDLLAEFPARAQSQVRDLTALRTAPPPRLAVLRRAAPGTAEGEQAPRTEVEEQIERLCGELLGLERTPMTESFFALGGHSLLVTRLAAAIRRDFDVELPLRSFFEARTLRDLAALLEDAILTSIEDLSEIEAARLVQAAEG